MDIAPLTLGRARAMRKTMTPPEAALWTHLRDKRLNGLKFRRQHPLGPYIRLAEQGIRTLRVSAEWVRSDMTGLLQPIAQAADAGR